MFPASSFPSQSISSSTSSKISPFLEESYWRHLLDPSFDKEKFHEEIDNSEEEAHLIQLSSGKTLIELILEVNQLDALEIILSQNSSEFKKSHKKRKIEKDSSFSTNSCTSPETFIQYINTFLKCTKDSTISRISYFLQLFDTAFSQRFVSSFSPEQVFDQNIRILHVAVLIGNIPLIKSLLNDSSQKKLIDTKNSKGIFSGTALHIAAEMGNLDIVKILVEHGADIDKEDDKGDSALHSATRNNHLEVAKYFLENSDTSESIDFINHSYQTALDLAAENGNLDMVKIFVEHDADIDREDEQGCSPLHSATRNNQLQVAKYFLENSRTHKLIDNKTPQETDAQTALHIAAEYGYLEMVKILVEHGADIYEEDDKGDSALHSATRNNHLEVAKYFLENSRTHKLIDKKTLQETDAHKTDAQTALHIAAEYGYLEMVKILVEHGADINIKDTDGWTPLHYAVESSRGEVVEFFLTLEKGKNLINQRSFRSTDAQTALHIAAKMGNLEMVKILLAHNANMGISDSLFYIPLHYAIKRKQVKIVETFLANKQIPWVINQPTPSEFSCVSGPTPLHLAVESGIPEMVVWLLKKGAEITKRSNGYTCLHQAVIFNHLEIVKILLNHSRIKEILNEKSWRFHIAYNYQKDQTALFEAAQQKDLVLFHLLLEAGALLDQKNQEQNLTLINNISINGLHSIPLSPQETVKKEKETLINSIFSLAKLTVLDNLDHFSFVVKYGSNQNISEALALFKLPSNLHEKRIDILSNEQHFTLKEKKSDKSNFLAALHASLLHEATLDSHLQVVNHSLDGTKINMLLDEQISDDSDTQAQLDLYLAAKNGDLDKIKTLINQDCKININNASGWSPLHVATWYNHLPVVKYFLEISQSNELVDKQTPQNSEAQTALHLAAEEGYLDIIQVLLDHGANINLLSSDGWTPLHYAAINNRWKVVEFFLSLEQGKKILNQLSSIDGGSNPKSDTAETPLHLAAKKGHLKSVQVLLAYNANMCIGDGNASTPLHIALSYKYLEVVEAFLANEQLPLVINLPYMNGFPFLLGETALHLAVGTRGTSHIVQSLLKNGAEITHRHDGSTCLHEAVTCNNLESIKILLNHSRIREILDERDLLFYAARNEDLAIFHLLLEAGVPLDQKYQERNLNLLNNLSRNGLKTIKNSLPGNFIKEKETLIKSIFFLAKLTHLDDAAPFSFILKYGSNQDISDALNQFKDENLLIQHENLLSEELALAFQEKNFNKSNFLIAKGASLFPLFKVTPRYTDLEELIDKVTVAQWDIYHEGNRKHSVFNLAVKSGQYCQENLIFLFKKNASNYNFINHLGEEPYRTAIIIGNIPALRIFDCFSRINKSLIFNMEFRHNSNFYTQSFPLLGGVIAFGTIESVKYLFLTLPYATLKNQYQTSHNHLKRIVSQYQVDQNIRKRINANLTTLEGYLNSPKDSYLALRNEMNIPTPTLKLTMLYAVIQDDYFHVPSAPLEDPQQEKNRRFLKIMSQLHKDALNPFLSAVKGHDLPSLFDSEGIIIGDFKTIEMRALINGGFSTQT